MHQALAIMGIHTDIGKTMASAVLAEALHADYWKPVQAGTLDNSDSMTVRELLTNGAKRVHPEAVMLSQPLSPHAAARIDNTAIDHTRFDLPHTDNILLIETAGGILSPMSDTATMADFVKYFGWPAILVASNYLGSINHTLMSIEVLKSRNIPIIGIAISGEGNASSEQYIEDYGKVPIIARIPFFSQISAEAINTCATNIRSSLTQYMQNAGY